MYETVEITCLTKVFYVTAFGFVGCWCFSEGKLVGASINKSKKENKKQVLKSFLAMYCCLLVLLHVTCY